jgi:transposase InsO family protein
MAQKVTAMDIRAATALAGEIENVAEFCRRHQISRVTFYKWRARFAEQGLAGLQELSRRPQSCPRATDAPVVAAVLGCRVELLKAGLDYGPQSIVWTLHRRGVVAVPSRATVARILNRHGLIDPQPRKRPKSATKRFRFSRPNECWQSDWTEWRLADGSAAAIAGTLDDHSRYLTGLQGAAGCGTGKLVWSVMLAGITECGIPAMSLTDNGFVYTGRWRGFESAFEVNLRALGTRTINSAPFHPQTCGKIERFWQTLKNWLNAHPAPATVDELNDQLAVFRDHYNHDRPHRALRGATPAEVFHATEKARPAQQPLPGPVFVNRQVVSASSGNLTVGPYIVNVGRQWSGHLCDTICDGTHLVVFSGTTLVRELTANPNRRYQNGQRRPGTHGKRQPKPTSWV